MIAAGGASRSSAEPRVQSLVVQPERPSVSAMPPMWATQKLGRPVPRSVTSNRSANGSSRARTSSRRAPQMRMGSVGGPS